MNVPFSSMIVYMNEKLKHLFKVKEGDNHLNYYLCGGLAGALASIPTCPFDVIKTKLNTQSCANNFCEKKVVCDILKQKTIDYKNIGKNEPSLKMSIFTEKTPIIKYHTIIDTSLTIFKEEGVAGFFSGLKMRMAIQSVSSAIAWGTYQMVKSTFSNFSDRY